MEEDPAIEIQKKADVFESQYNKVKKEFKDYIETSKRNEETKKREMRSDSAKKMLVLADSLCRMSLIDTRGSCDTLKNYSENFQKNLDVMYHQLLSASGLIPIDPAPGDTFEATRHMAVGLEYGNLYPEETIFRVIRRGYCIEDKVLRPAEVIISKRPCELLKVKKTGILKNFTSWIFPANRRFAQIDQKIDELKQVQSQKNLILQQEMERFQDLIVQSAAEKEKIDDLCTIQAEKIEQLEKEIDTLHDLAAKSAAESQKFGALEQMVKEISVYIEQELIALNNSISLVIGEKKKIHEIELTCYAIVHQCEQKVSALEDKINAAERESQNTQPALEETPEKSDEIVLQQIDRTTQIKPQDQQNEEEDPVLDEDTNEDNEKKPWNLWL
jgi:molecular chaperone GrpE